MTIKQQGGIFGRNPTFNDVDVEGTLTVGGTYTLPTTDGTIGQVLTTDGAGVVTFSAAGGGGTYTAGTGLSLTGTVFANTDPDQTVSLTQGGATTISGTYPNFTISSTDTNTTYTAGTGLALTGTVFSNTITNNNQLTNGAAYVDNAGVDTHLNTGTATTGEVLSWTGTDYDWITAGGGTALELYAENPVSPTPSATGDNAVAIGFNARASGTKAVALIEGNASGLRGFAVGFNAAASGGNSTALGASSVSSGGSSVAIGQSATATANQSLALGYQATTATGNWPTAIGRSYASGSDSFAAAIADNSATYGATGASSVAIGRLAKATGQDAIAIGDTTTASGTNAIAFGNMAVASATKSTVIGGDGNVASGGKSVAIGGYYAEAREECKIAFGGGYIGVDVATNAYQAGLLCMGAATTDATATVLRSSNAAASATNQIILPNNSAYSFSGTIIARQSAAAGSNYASWEVKGALLRDANAASTVLGNGIVNKLFATAGAAAWDIALTADTTNGGLAITATGAAATSIRWVATISTSEVTYA